MATTGIKVQGLRETVRSLERMGVDVQDLKAAFSAISREVASEATGIVRVASGAARNSIRIANTKNKAVVRAGSARVPYAGVLNYGWPARGIEGDEFLTGPANRDTARKAAQISANLRLLIRKYDLN